MASGGAWWEVLRMEEVLVVGLHRDWPGRVEGTVCPVFGTRSTPGGSADKRLRKEGKRAMNEKEINRSLEKTNV